MVLSKQSLQNNGSAAAAVIAAMKGHTDIGHELLANGSDLLAESCREHHHLLVVRSHLEDFLDIPAHICRREHASLCEQSPRNFD